MRHAHVLFVFLFSFSVYSSEIDSFTHRYEDLPNILEELNQYSNRLFDSALYRANKKNKCDEKKLYKELKSSLGGVLGTVKAFENGEKVKLKVLRKWLLEKEGISGRKVPIKESIYQDLSIRDSFIVFFGSLLKSPLGVVFNIQTDKNFDRFLIGSDKFAHFFNHGWRYFKWRYNKGKSMEKVLDKGDNLELRLYGRYMTGVISHADLAANLDGFRFWNSILAKDEDILTGQKPMAYVKCQNNKWVKQRELDYTEYIDASWDEGHNCSFVRNRRMVSKINRRINDLEREDGKRYACPISYEALDIASSRWKKFSERVINSNGIILNRK